MLHEHILHKVQAGERLEAHEWFEAMRAMRATRANENNESGQTGTCHVHQAPPSSSLDEEQGVNQGPRQRNIASEGTEINTPSEGNKGKQKTQKARGAVKLHPAKKETKHVPASNANPCEICEYQRCYVLMTCRHCLRKACFRCRLALREGGTCICVDCRLQGVDLHSDEDESSREEENREDEDDHEAALRDVIPPKDPSTSPDERVRQHGSGDNDQDTQQRGKFPPSKNASAVVSPQTFKEMHSSAANDETLKCCVPGCVTQPQELLSICNLCLVHDDQCQLLCRQHRRVGRNLNVRWWQCPCHELGKKRGEFNHYLIQ
jgi:hypothetical protein